MVPVVGSDATSSESVPASLFGGESAMSTWVAAVFAGAAWSSAAAGVPVAAVTPGGAGVPGGASLGTVALDVVSSGAVATGVVGAAPGAACSTAGAALTTAGGAGCVFARPVARITTTPRANTMPNRAAPPISNHCLIRLRLRYFREVAGRSRVGCRLRSLRRWARGAGRVWYSRSARLFRSERFGGRHKVLTELEFPLGTRGIRIHVGFGCDRRDGGGRCGR